MKQQPLGAQLVQLRNERDNALRLLKIALLATQGQRVEKSGSTEDLKNYNVIENDSYVMLEERDTKNSPEYNQFQKLVKEVYCRPLWSYTDLALTVDDVTKLTLSGRFPINSKALEYLINRLVWEYGYLVIVYDADGVDISKSYTITTATCLR